MENEESRKTAKNVWTIAVVKMQTNDRIWLSNVSCGWYIIEMYEICILCVTVRCLNISVSFCRCHSENHKNGHELKKKKEANENREHL